MLIVTGCVDAGLLGGQEAAGMVAQQGTQLFMVHAASWPLLGHGAGKMAQRTGKPQCLTGLSGA